ncbi:hypothetical protein ECANGB1_2095 [Enterospora canceri]|uniref:Uncharacterized protein n=1 Tax=Enterospora canceri TaxID=1081671 RepID=A0A1Y1S8X3_9MICR|nr:hypothetical protein ECANGB1_2095 [Enterospora canceri]
MLLIFRILLVIDSSTVQLREETYKRTGLLEHKEDEEKRKVGHQVAEDYANNGNVFENIND